MSKTIILFLLSYFSLTHIYSQEQIEKAIFVKNELLIWLEPNVDAYDFANKYAHYGIRPKEKVTKSFNIWLFSYSKRGLRTSELLLTYFQILVSNMFKTTIT